MIISFTAEITAVVRSDNAERKDSCTYNCRAKRYPVIANWRQH